VTQLPGAPQFTFVGVADWDADGKNDIIARKDSIGDLYLYRGNNTTGYSPYPPTKIGTAGRPTNKQRRSPPQPRV
jgi:hypothetical protein